MANESKPEKRLTPKQKRFIVELFCRKCDFQMARQICKVSERDLDRWLVDPRFREEIRRRVDRLRFEAGIEAAMGLPLAARSLRDSTYCGPDHIRYAAGRDLLRAGIWLRKSPHSVPEDLESISPFLPGTLKSIEKLLKAKQEEAA